MYEVEDVLALGQLLRAPSMLVDASALEGARKAWHGNVRDAHVTRDLHGRLLPNERKNSSRDMSIPSIQQPQALVPLELFKFTGHDFALPTASRRTKRMTTSTGTRERADERGQCYEHVMQQPCGHITAGRTTVSANL